MTKSTKSSTDQFTAPDELTIQKVESLADLWLGKLTEAEAVEVDLSRVLEMDTAGLQLLLRLQSQSRSLGLEMRITKVSAAARHTLELCRLEELLPTGDVQ